MYGNYLGGTQCHNFALSLIFFTVESPLTQTQLESVAREIHTECPFHKSILFLINAIDS